MFLATSHKHSSELCLAQIGKKPINDKFHDREGYSLGAGIALGLINLGKGTADPKIEKLNLMERLIRMAEGGQLMEPPQS